MNASPGRFASDLESSLGPLGGHKVHKSLKFCIMAGTAMPRSHRGTGVSPVKDWVAWLTGEFYPGSPGSARFQRAHGFPIHRARKRRALPDSFLTPLLL